MGAIPSADWQAAVNPYPGTGGPDDQRLAREVFSDIVADYTMSRARAWQEWHEASDQAWAIYRAAMNRAGLQYEQATMEAAGRFGRAMGGLA